MAASEFPAEASPWPVYFAASTLPIAMAMESRGRRVVQERAMDNLAQKPINATTTTGGIY